MKNSLRSGIVLLLCCLLFCTAGLAEGPEKSTDQSPIEVAFVLLLQKDVPSSDVADAASAALSLLPPDQEVGITFFNGNQEVGSYSGSGAALLKNTYDSISKLTPTNLSKPQLRGALKKGLDVLKGPGEKLAFVIACNQQADYASQYQKDAADRPDVRTAYIQLGEKSQTEVQADLSRAYSAITSDVLREVAEQTLSLLNMPLQALATLPGKADYPHEGDRYTAGWHCVLFATTPGFSGRVQVMEGTGVPDAQLGVEAGVCGYTSLTYDQYELQRAGSVSETKKSEPLSMTGVIDRLTKAAENEVDDWQVTLHVSSENNTQPAAVYPMERNPESGQYVAKGVPFNKSGSFTCQILAASASVPSLTTASAPFQITVVNEGPTLLRKGPLVLTRWKNSPIELASMKQDITECFNDDDKAALTYKAINDQGEPLAGISVNSEGWLIINENCDPSIESFRIIAVDTEGETAELLAQIHQQDVMVALQSGDCELMIDKSGNNNYEFKKGEGVTLRGEYTFSEAGQRYLKDLAELGEAQRENFLRGIKGFFTVDDAELEPVDPSIAQDEPGNWMLFYTVSLPTETSGQHKAIFRVQWNNAEGKTVTHDQGSFQAAYEVLNKAPAILPGKETSALSFVLHDDSILNGLSGLKGLLPALETQAVKESEELDLAQYTEAGEAGEVLTFTPKAKGMTLVKVTEDKYKLTDSHATDDKLTSFDWKVGEPAPKLIIERFNPGNIAITVDVFDGESHGSFAIETSAKFVNEELRERLIKAGLILLAAIVLLILIVWLIKPAMKGKTIILTTNSYTRTLPLKAWRKKKLTLWDAILYTGLPVTGGASCKCYEHVRIAPAHGNRILIKAERAAGCVMVVDNEKTTQSAKVGAGSHVLLTFGETQIGIEVQ